MKFIYAPMMKKSLMFSSTFHSVFGSNLNIEFVLTFESLVIFIPDSLTLLCGCLSRLFLASSRSRRKNETKH